MGQPPSWDIICYGILSYKRTVYFGMLIPMAAMEGEGYFLPVVYALATGLPVMLAAWVLAYSVSGIGKFYNKMQVFQKWFSRIVAVVFIFVGIYYGLMMYNLI